MPTPRRSGSRRQNKHPRKQSSTLPQAPSRVAGLIMWLPPLDDLPDHDELDEGCYDHPVVILSPAASHTEEVVILILTSFNDTDLLTKFRYNPARRLDYLPIHPAKPRPDTAAQLYLENGLVLRRRSYVNTREKHTVPFSILWPYNHKEPTSRYMLTTSSYQELVAAADFRSGIDMSIISPVSDAWERERERERESYRTYGTIPAVASTSRAAASDGHRDRYGHSIGVPGSHPTGISSHTPTTPRRGVASGPRDTLPRYHARGRDGGGNGDWLDVVKVLVMIAGFVAVVAAVVYFGVRWAWQNGALIASVSVRGASWLGQSAWELGKGVVRGVGRGVSWLVKKVGMMMAGKKESL